MLSLFRINVTLKLRVYKVGTIVLIAFILNCTKLCTLSEMFSPLVWENNCLLLPSKIYIKQVITYTDNKTFG